MKLNSDACFDMFLYQILNKAVENLSFIHLLLVLRPLLSSKATLENWQFLHELNIQISILQMFCFEIYKYLHSYFSLCGCRRESFTMFRFSAKFAMNAYFDS